MWKLAKWWWQTCLCSGSGKFYEAEKNCEIKKSCLRKMVNFRVPKSEAEAKQMIGLEWRLVSTLNSLNKRKEIKHHFFLITTFYSSCLTTLHNCQTNLIDVTLVVEIMRVTNLQLNKQDHLLTTPSMCSWLFIIRIACRDEWAEYEQDIFREHEVISFLIRKNSRQKIDCSLFF